MARKSIDTPLAEITLRRYEKPYNLSKRELVRKLCLSLGLLQPGDSRDVIVDVFYVLLEAVKERKELASEEIQKQVIDFRKQNNLDELGTAASNIRRQLRRLRQLFLVEKVKNNYRITEFSKLSETFENKLERFLIPSVMQRLKEYLVEIDNNFTKTQ
ncbi:hypothetical protein JW930_01580 [Candidatus Woesearchaeota archaeon]|nr:hypothetical protein [Candidatus Woesearchaeota archaeon]